MQVRRTFLYKEFIKIDGIIIIFEKTIEYCFSVIGISMKSDSITLNLDFMFE